MTQYHPWFERVYRKLGLPFWIGVIIIGLLPFVILRSLAFLLSPHGLDYSALAYLVGWAVLILGSQYGSRHIVSTMDRLKEQTSTMSEIKPLDDSSVKRSLYTMILSGASGIALVAIWFPAIPGEPLLSRVVRPISVFYGGTSFLQFMLVYALASSAFRGTPSLKLKPFTEDLFMGLRPFGTAALHVAGTVSLLLSTIFFAFTSSLVLAIGNSPLYFVATQALIFSFIPGLTAFLTAIYLRSYHRIMRQEKARMIHWVSSLYTETMRSLESSHDDVSERLAEVGGIGRLHDDVERIKEWPVDMHILARTLALLVGAGGLVSTLLTLVTNLRSLFP